MLRRLLNWLRDFARLRDGLLLAVVALLPWQARFIRKVGDLAGAPWEQGTLAISVVEVLIFAALLCHLLARTFALGKRVAAPSWLRFWALFILYAGFSAMWAREPLAAFMTWLHLVEGCALCYLVWQSGLSLRAILGAFLVGEAANAALGLWQFFSQTTFASTLLGIAAHPAGEAGSVVIETGAGRWLRAYGLLPHPNIFGGYMAAAFLATLALASGSENKKEKRILAVACGLFVAGLAVSFSRSAWITATTSVIAFAVRRAAWNIDVRVAFRKTLTAVLLVLAGLALVIWPLMATRVTGAGRLEGKSLSDRLLSLSQSVQLFGANYAVGVGAGNFQPAAYDDTLPQLDDPYQYQPVHFVPALAAVELGLFGLLILIGAVWLWAYETKAAFRLVTTPFAHFALAAPIIPIIVGSFDHWPLSLLSGALLTGLLFGLSLREADHAIS